MKKKHKQYLAYFFAIAVFFFWLGLLCGAGMADHRNQKQSEKFRIEMIKDSLYHEFIKLYK